MAKTYKGSLTLEWYNKQKSVLLSENSAGSISSDIPAPKLNWINQDEALFYEIIDDEGKGLQPFWVDRNDIRVKETRPLILKRCYFTKQEDIKGTIPNIATKWNIKETNKDDPQIDNILIKGDNLLALNVLKTIFLNKPDNEKIKCIYIDPPFNTGAAFENYDDSLAHSEWLTLMRDRLEILFQLLRPDGSIFVHLDDVEVHYLKVLLDGVFGRENFICTIAVRSSTPSGVKTAHKEKTIIKQKDLILVYRKSESTTFNPQYIRKSEWDTHFNYFLNKENETVRPLIEILIERKILPQGASLNDFDINNRSHYEFYKSYADFICQTQSHRNEEYKALSLKKKDKVLFVNKGQENEVMFYNGRQLTPLSNSMFTLYHNKLKTEDFGMLLCDFWNDIDFQNTQNEGNVSFPNSKKPEELMLRIFDLATNEGDYILDSFAGSGTSLAVAHKMKRKWIGIEVGNHADTHIIKRLKPILLGEDNTGVTPETNWKGGGSFKYYHIGNSIIKLNKNGEYDFSWDLGKKFIEKSLLLSYDYIINDEFTESIKLFESEDDKPVIGTQMVGNRKRVAVVSLNHPDQKQKQMTFDEIQSLCTSIRGKLKPDYINIFTNRGVEIAYDSKPDDLEIIKVPHAIFAELEK